jgi:heme-degrading monooxygenase HmoA
MADGPVAVLLLADVSASHRLWGWWRITRRAAPLAGSPGLLFGKVLGSGHEGGFGLRPSASRQGVFALFADAASAGRYAQGSPVIEAYRRRSRECCVVTLRAWSSRGRWSGHELPVSAARPGPGTPVASLTRASIRAGRAWRFWRRAPDTQAALEGAAGCRLAVGLGEAPLLRQATFSIWDSVAAMDAYARSGAHAEAIQAAQREQYFSESMFVRFSVLGIEGTWKGVRHG